MTRSRIIGHRGAAGLALENTLSSFAKAVEAGATAIEFDVRTTLDNQFVVCHDENLERVSPHNDAFVKELTLSEIRALQLHNGQPVPTLQEVLEFARQHKLKVIVEAKAIDDPTSFCELLDRYTNLDIVVASFKSSILASIHRLRPQLTLYLGESWPPFTTLHRIRRLGAHGIDLHYILMNPITYWLARRWQLEIMLFTPNNRFIVNVLLWLYPHVYICTDHPERFTNYKVKRKG